MVSIFFWVAFGAIIGWIAAILQNESVTRKVTTFIAAGAIGGLVGGFGGLLLSPGGVAAQSSTTDIMFAVFGATVFVFIADFAGQKHFRE
jgi:uncharacterized membrane protein YeaQ/YmgE (transglycosylase-associated protein family)